jgi:6-phosphofructokinase 1
LKRIGVVTSGGDAPGMNAAIRAVVRIADSKRMQILGFKRGWEGVIRNSVIPLTPRAVGGIMHSGGTILQTSRCPQFRKLEGIKEAAKTLALNNLVGLIVIGGNGSFKGALELSKETNTGIVGIPATIDNDVFGTDETIGFDTAINTAVNAIDKIRDTAASHERIFIVEVMGRERGFIALTVGLTAGAEIILIPEVPFDNYKLFETIKKNRNKGKKSGILVAAEGIRDIHNLARELEEETGAEVRISVLGYAQRGGNPTARSRLLASLFAKKAINVLVNEQENLIIGLQNGVTTSIELEKACKTKKPLDLSLLKLAEILST